MPKTHHPAVTAHDIQPPEMGDRIVHQLRRLRHLPHIGLEGHGVGAMGLDFGDDFFGRVPRVRVVDDDLGAAAPEVNGHGGADAAAGARDQGDFVVESEGGVGCHWVGSGEGGRGGGDNGWGGGVDGGA